MKTFSRRQVLRGLGGLSVGLPMLDALRARADVGTAPQRLLVVYTPNGVVPDNWFPTPGASPQSFTLGACHQPLVPFKDKLILFKNMQLHTCGNGFATPQYVTGSDPSSGYAEGSPSMGEPHQKGLGTLLTGTRLNPGSFVGGTGEMAGWASGPSIDQKIHAVVSQGRRSLQLGVRADNSPYPGGENRTRLSYLGSDNPLPPVNDPRQAFDDLFADVSQQPVTTALVRAQRKSVLDGVMNQFTSLNARLGGTDRAKLDQHLTLLRELETRVTTPPVTLMCDVPTRPGELALDDQNTMAALTQNHLDVVAAAFACDQVRVATLQISNSWNHIAYPWVQSLDEGHSLSHMGPSNMAAREQLTRRDTWHAEQVAYLLNRLNSIPEASGTVLDNTLVFWCNELALGSTHDQSDMPFLLAGSAGGVFRTGQYLQLGRGPGQDSTYSGRSHCDLLTTLVQGFGLTDTRVGEPEFNHGPITELRV